VREPIRTTVPVLTESFHMLGPGTFGSDRLREFIVKGGLSVWWFDRATLSRAFELMDVYADHPMDFADAWLIVAAETLATRTVFTIACQMARPHAGLPLDKLDKSRMLAFSRLAR
jgi:hypothetical protein